jgi:hypothetical protein
MVAKRTETKVKKAETVAMWARVPNVRGKEQKNEAIATIREKTTVQTAPPDMVLRYSAPTTQCRPWMKVLFRRNMTAVPHQAILESQNKY